jgi:hypothetical protein
MSETTSVEGVLAAHRTNAYASGFLPVCGCGWIGTSRLAWGVDLAAHQADELRKAGLVVDVTTMPATQFDRILAALTPTPTPTVQAWPQEDR